MPAKPRSLVVYRGPSRYDPTATIRAVVILRSVNRKTGNMAQLYILRDDCRPTDAQRTGCDAAVCGACPFRPAINGGCYVVTSQGPTVVFKTTSALPVADESAVRSALAGRALRLGAYGDAAALPADVVAMLVDAVEGRVTGYTHGHKLLGLPGVAHLRSSCMLSVESPEAAAEAHAAGWRTFRSRAEGAPLMRREIECPSERGVSCVDCLLCGGAGKRAANVSIPVHGFTVGKALKVVA